MDMQIEKLEGAGEETKFSVPSLVQQKQTYTMSQMRQMRKNVEIQQLRINEQIGYIDEIIVNMEEMAKRRSISSIAPQFIYDREDKDDRDTAKDTGILRRQTDFFH